VSRHFIRTMRANNTLHANRAIAAAPVDIPAVVADGATALDDPAHLAVHLDFMSDLRGMYGPCAMALERLVLAQPKASAFRLVSTLHETAMAEWIKAWRIAGDLRLTPPNSETHTRPPYSIEEMIEETGGRRGKLAWIGLHVLGRVRSAIGVARIEDCDVANPGFWPTASRERAGLALHLIVRRFHGDRIPLHLERQR
jgi:hypothetical protein